MKKISRKQAVEELVFCAINTLIVAANKNTTPKIIVPYITLCMASGRIEELCEHLRRAQINMESE